MRSFSATGIPINPGALAQLSSPRAFGTSPFRAYDPGMGVFARKRGMRGACGCSPVGGCSCAPGLGGLRQNVSLDQIISNAFNWFSGMVESNLPDSAAVPPQYGSPGALGTQLMQWAPWVIGGYLVYRLIK